MKPKLKKHAALAGLFACLQPLLALAAEGDLPLDASGRRGDAGLNGANGANGSSGFFSSDGSNGKRGDNATPALPGQAAGSADVFVSRATGLEDHPVNGAVVVRGTVISPQNGTTTLDGIYQFGDTGKIPVNLIGGMGGHGGNGGQGGKGGDGGNGISATRYSSGTNGGDGGDGGAGGNATSGATGGAGGRGSATFPPDQTDLAMLFGDISVRGGFGGVPGTNGPGGARGSGGMGGASASGTEQTGTDSKGNPTTTTWSQSGGISGSDGRQGPDGNANVTRGQNGPAGKFEFRVATPEGTQTYDRRFDLAINQPFVIEDGNHDGIYEPGEEGTIRRVTVENTGGMPLPQKPVEISLNPGAWIRPANEHPFVGPALKRDDSITLPNEFHFQLKDTQVTEPGDPLKTRDTASFDAKQTGVNRHYEKFDRPTPFTVQFPIEITPIRISESLLPGQSAPLRWKVKNISKRDFGSAEELRREIATGLKLDPSKVSTDAFEFRDSKGQVVPLDQGFFAAISSLKADSSIVIEGKLTIKPGAAPFSNVALKTELDLGKINAPAETRPIQYQDVVVHVTKTYQKTPGSQMLIVTNNHTTQAEMKSWTSLTASLGIPLDIWDTSYEGSLKMDQALNEGKSSLNRDFGGQTVVLLNNDRPAADMPDKTLQADAMIPKRDLLKSAAERDTHFYFVGKEQARNDRITDFFLLPSVRREENPSVKDDGALLKSAVQASLTKSAGGVGQFKTTDFCLFGKTESDDFSEDADALAKKLDKKNPGQRFYVVPEFDGSLAKSHWYGNDYRQGNTEVFKSLPATSSHFTMLAATNDEVHDPAFILGRQNLRGLLNAMPLDQKLNAYVSYLGGDFPKGADEARRKEAGRWIPEALLADIATEQKALRASSHSYGHPKLPMLERVLDRLEKSAKGSLGSTDARLKASGDSLLELLAQAQFLSDASIGGGDSVKRIRETVAKTLGERAKLAGGNFASAEQKMAQQKFDRRVAELKANWPQGMDPVDEAAQVARGRLTRDSNLAVNPKGRTMCRAEYDRRMTEMNPIQEQREAFAVKTAADHKEVFQTTMEASVLPGPERENPTLVEAPRVEP
jgi:hypothetical protein